jgi:hypothetical protein
MLALAPTGTVRRVAWRCVGAQWPSAAGLPGTGAGPHAAPARPAGRPGGARGPEGARTAPRMGLTVIWEATWLREGEAVERARRKELRSPTPHATLVEHPSSADPKKTKRAGAGPDGDDAPRARSAL